MNPARAGGRIDVYRPPITVSLAVKFLPCGHPTHCAKSTNLTTNGRGEEVYIPHGCQWCDDLAARDGRIADLESQLRASGGPARI